MARPWANAAAKMGKPDGSRTLKRPHRLAEHHLAGRAGWLRAAVLGANDGILSTSSLILGVASAAASHQSIFLTGVAGLVAGAMSMAAGEYVSVSSQSDAQKADLKKEKAELIEYPEAEHRELAAIYVKRGVQPALAKKVADQMMAKDALGTHARDELAISEATQARPVQAAAASAASYATGAAVPLLMVILSPQPLLRPVVAAASLACLAILGAVGAKAGGAGIWKAMARVTLWGALAMAATAAIGSLVGAAV